MSDAVPYIIIGVVLACVVATLLCCAYFALSTRRQRAKPEHDHVSCYLCNKMRIKVGGGGGREEMK